MSPIAPWPSGWRDSTSARGNWQRIIGPGPLTLVLPRQKDCPVSLLATAGLDTLAIRLPHHPVAAALLQAFGGPIAAPSANPSGRLSPTDAAHVAELSGRQRGDDPRRRRHADRT